MVANNTPTAFTDDELERLKIWVKDNPHEDDDGLSIRGTKRLLNRLEAAEKAIRYLLVVCQDDRESGEYTDGIADEAGEALDAWRISTGVEPLGRIPR